MIIVSARVNLQPGKRDAFIAAAQPVIAATRREEGNILYELYASTENADMVMYFEKWADRAALDAHLKAPHMVAFGKYRTENNLVDGPSDVQIFDVLDDASA